MAKVFCAQYTTQKPFPDEKAAGRLMNEYMQWAASRSIGADLCMRMSPRSILISISFRYETMKARKARLAEATKKMRELFGEIDLAN